ncbi:porin [Pseudoponticoccus marisrubri]|uniref:Porin domain-containing protein n=1 Tax=Pseudoponticoccus marisrubri TaxID=1685382 RepID=A0A0W7WKL4_9RHOB|nr:porin [Pseudoponticoccus marisrubri]KUF11071.1 hypothetical protein AVJ23_08415 [Pseudoponticoccus marisrubri]
MKKILFATTALVATAGAASAEIALSGSAEIGILGGSDFIYETTQFHTDIDVTFTMTGEADNGLTFGAKVDLDENGAFGNTTQGGETYFVAFGGARLDMGDVDGAFDAALTEAIIGSAIADDHEHAGYNGNAGLDGSYDGQIATFSYTFDAFTGYLSAEIDDTGTFDPVYGIGMKYSVDVSNATIGMGIGYQSGDQAAANASFGAAVAAANAAANGTPADPVNFVAATPGYLGNNPGDNDGAFATAVLAGQALAVRSEVIGVSFDATFDNGLQAIVNYSEAQYSDVAGTNDETETHLGLALGYTMNALTVGVNYGKYEDFLGVDDLEAEGYGLAVNYDLGGGLEAQFGYGNSEYSTPAGGGLSKSIDTYSLGLAMSF